MYMCSVIGISSSVFVSVHSPAPRGSPAPRTRTHSPAAHCACMVHGVEPSRLRHALGYARLSSNSNAPFLL